MKSSASQKPIFGKVSKFDEYVSGPLNSARILPMSRRQSTSRATTVASSSRPTQKRSAPAACASRA
jgi:hypothetical protein